MPKYRDWLKAEQANINPAGTPVIVRPSETVGAGYAALTMRNEQIRNTPETARGGYSALAPDAPVQSASVPRLAASSASTPATEYYAGRALDNASKATMKQNNPALYSQLVTQGIIKPITEGEKTVPATTSAPATAPATEPRTDTASPSTGETEATGYAKYLAQHPEYAEADRRAEAEYARSLPTYGALAEQMAQAGIHGGYSDYLQGVAYSQMQNAKQQNEEAARAGYAALTGNGGVGGTTSAQIGAMYDMFGKGGYTDAEGNTVQGYNLLEIVNDEDYKNAKARARADAIYRGADEATVDAALAQVDAMRDTVKEQIQTGVSDKMTKYNEGKLEPAKLIAAIGYTPKDGESEGVTFFSALDYAVENKLITPEQRSEALKVGLSLYGDKPSAKDVLKSIKTAIELNDEGAMTDKDKNAVLDDALKAVETYFKGKKWTVKIESGKLYAKNKAGEWEDLGNLKNKSEFATVFRGSYYDDVVKLVYENRNKK